MTPERRRADQPVTVGARQAELLPLFDQPVTLRLAAGSATKQDDVLVALDAGDHPGCP